MYNIKGYEFEKYNLKKSLVKKDLKTFEKNLLIIKSGVEEVLLEVIIKYFEEFNK